MTARRLGDRSLHHRAPHGPLHALLVHVMATALSTARIGGNSIRRKYVLPAPLEGSRRILARQCMGQPHRAMALGDITFEQGLPHRQVARQRFDEFVGQGHHPILAALTVAHQ